MESGKNYHCSQSANPIHLCQMYFTGQTLFLQWSCNTLKLWRRQYHYCHLWHHNAATTYNILYTQTKYKWWKENNMLK